MLCRVTLVITDVSEERSASIIRVTRIGELERTLVFLCSMRRLLITANVVSNADSCHPDNEGNKFLGKVSSYKSHTA
jgi:hypothetical protein